MEPLTTAALITGGSQILGSLLGGFGARDAGREKRRAINNAMQTTNQGYDQALSFQQPLLDIGMGGLRGASALAGNDIPEGQFTDTALNVDRFLNPAMDYEIQQASNALLGSALGQGISKSGATMRGLQENAQQMARGNYQNAVGQAMQDRSFNAQNYMANLQARRDARAQRMNELMGIGQIGVNTAGNMTNLATGRSSALSNLQLGKGEVNAQMSALPYQIGGQMLNTIGQGASQYLGATGGAPTSSLPTTPSQAQPLGY